MRWSQLDHVQRFSILALVCVLASALTFGWLVKSTVHKIVQTREDELTGMIVEHQILDHFSTDLFASADAFRDEALRKRILDALYLENVFRVKIYNDDGTILWSDESELIGRRFPDNEFLNRALAGEVVSVVETPHREEHEFERGAFDQIMETYVPIHEDDFVVGVVEVYRHPKKFFGQLRRSAWVVWSVTLGGGTLVYLAMVTVVRKINTFQRRLEMDLRRSAKELKEEKSRLDRIVNAMGAGLVLVNSEGHIKWANQTAELWFGRENLVGSRSHRGLCNLDEVCGDCPFDPDSSPKYPVRCEIKLPEFPPRGRVFEMMTTAEPSKDAAGEHHHFLQLIIDVTESKEVEAQLQQAAKMSLMGQLAGGIAHQINNPVGILLTTITHHLATSDDGSRANEWRSDLETMERQCRRIDHAVKSLLSFSRTSQGISVPVDLEEIIDEAVLLTRPRMKQSSVELESRLEEGLPKTMGDPNELLQIVLNLLNNAIDAMPEGGRLGIELGAAAPDNLRDGGQASLLFTVSDTGCGIPREDADDVFEPFFTTKEVGSGTGLGLTVAKRIIESVGGAIWVDQGSSDGAVFRVLLPRVEGTHAA